MHARLEVLQADEVGTTPLPHPGVAGKDVILVDDGIATGTRMRAALADVRRRGARSVVVATPVASPAAYAELARLADNDVVAVEVPENSGPSGLRGLPPGGCPATVLAKTAS